MTTWGLPPAAAAIVNHAVGMHKHPKDVEVIQHPNYGPRVKLVCRLCPGETYVNIETGDPEIGPDPLTEEEKQVAYMRQLIDLEKDGKRTTIVIGPFSAMTIIGLIQLATRHPDMEKRTKDIARDFIRQLEPLFSGTEGEEIIRRGGHPEFDK